MNDFLDEKKEVIAHFQFPGELKEAISYGNGHINDTFRLTFWEDGKQKRYILQKMNKEVFHNPVELMENIMGVTSWLKKKITERGGDPDRETLNVIPDLNGKSYYQDIHGEYWRAYNYIEHATSFDQVENRDDFYQSAVAFGNFQSLLADYPADTLHETIPHFHDTEDRFLKFSRAVEADVCGRAGDIQEEIAFVRENRELTHILTDQNMPLRVTHNDTKLNNIMIDDETHKGICVIDLDTVMPGLAVNDFGDSIRFGASTAAEDEQDLSKVACDLELFELYTKGFIEGCQGKLTETELDHLPTGAMVMTYECGMRFLTDYLEGDHYFKIHRPNHNLDRCRTQFQLVKDMQQKLGQMCDIVNKYK